MKLKKEYIVLIVVIAGLAFYLATRSADRNDQPLVQPPKLESAKINRIVLTDKKNPPLEMVKKDERWFIQPQGYPADKGKIKNMLDALADVTLTALVSESRNYERYGLAQPEKVGVQAFSDGASVRSLSIGKTAPTYQHTFMLLEGDPNIYHARGQLGRTFDQTVETLRDKTIFDLPKESITALTLRKNGRSVVVTKQASPEDQATPARAGSPEDQATPARASAPAEEQQPAAAKPSSPEEQASQARGASPKEPATPAKGGEVEWQIDGSRVQDQDKVEQLLSELTHLNCDSFLQDDAKARLGQPEWSIAFKKGQEEFTLSSFPKLEDAAEKLPGTASTTPYGFLLGKARVQSIEKAMDDLLGTTAPKR